MPADFVEKGQALTASGQHQEAVKVCRLGLLAHPTDLDGRLVLGSALLALRRFDEVLAEMRVALEIDQASAGALALKAEALLSKGDAQQALVVLGEARNAAPGDPHIEALIERAHGYGVASTDAPADVTAVERPGRAFPSNDDSGEMELSGADLLPVTPSPDLQSPRVAGPDGATMAEVSVSALQSTRAEAVPPMPARPSLPPPARVPIAAPSAATRAELPPPPRPAPLKEQRFGVIPKAAPGAATVAMMPESGERATLLGVGPTDAAMLEASGDAALSMFADGESHSGLDDPDEVPPSPGDPVPSHSQDMRMIRAGLGLPEATATDLSAQPGSKAEAKSAQPIAPNLKQKKAKKSAARRRAAAAQKPRKSRLRGLVYVVLGLAVITGAVFAGFKVREIRLEQQIHYALGDGARKAVTDTFKGYLDALAAYQRILDVRQNPETLVARADTAARLAAEMGYDIEHARQWVETAPTVPGNVGTASARVYLDVAEGKLDDARHDLDALTSAFPREAALAAYLRGRIALADGDIAGAVEALDGALADRRPFPFVRLAEAELEAGRYDAALAALGTALEEVDRHPMALIVRGRVLARARRADELDAKADLTELVAEGGMDVKQQTLGVSHLELAWAGLALSEIEHALGEDEAARQAVLTAVGSRGGSVRLGEATVAHLIALGQLDDAARLADAMAKEAGERRLTRLAQARVALARHQASDALADLESMGDIAGFPAALTVRGLAHLAAGHRDQAVADLDAVLAMTPKSEAAVLGRARADILAGDGKAAKRRLDSLFEDIDEAPLDVGIAYAQAIAESGDVDRARGLLKDVARHHDTPAVWVALARIEGADGHRDAARKAFEHAVELDAHDSNAVVGLARLAIDSAELDTASKALDGWTGDAPAVILAEKAHLATLRGDHEHAKAFLEKARTAGGDTALVSRETGRLALRSQDPETAVLRLSEAAAQRPADGDTRLLLLEAAIAARSAGKAVAVSPEDVVADIEKALAGKPEVNLARGVLQVFQKKPKDALATLSAARTRMAEERRPARLRAEVDFYIGRAQYLAGDLEKARAALKGAIERNPGDADAYYFLGQIEFEAESFDDAVKAYQKAVELDALGNPRAWFYLGDVSHVLGKDDISRAALDAYVEHFPGGPDIDAVKRLRAKL